MGHSSVTSATDRQIRAEYSKHLLTDLEALDLMLERDLFEKGVTRIGAEQEFCLVSKNWKPENNAEEILKSLDDPHFTTELARFNLELNLDPVVLAGHCFDDIQKQLEGLLEKAKYEAAKRDTHILLTGILPTVSKTELSLEYMTPQPRYFSLNEMVKGIRDGNDFHLHISGIDELSVTHDSVLMEACNTSFQMHLQVDSSDFVDAYNWAQAISGPVLGICANSPLLLGRELWNETRIALFKQSIDTRITSYALKDQVPRVTFGDSWVSGSASEIFKNDVAQHKIILARTIENNGLEQLEEGKIPKLRALNIHNGTVYRWNRPCYGISDGKPHLRIENRYIPAGPTVVDQMANFAFWVGLMMGRSEVYNLSSQMDFKDAKSNFIRAARTGKETVLRWRGRKVSVRDLITRELLPIAKNGLAKMKIDPTTSERLLKVIEQRAVKNTGAQWTIENYRRYKKEMTQSDALMALTKSMYENQQTNKPVHEWPDVSIQPHTHEFATQVGDIMSTRLFTIYEDDLAEMATQIMKWKNIHHLPVENQAGEITGLLTWTQMQNFQKSGHDKHSYSVGDIMTSDIFLAHQGMLITEAIEIMKRNEIGCLPVVHNKHLIGIITIKDLIKFDNGQRP